MAVDPDTIEQEQEKPLSDKDREVADHYERRIDVFLTLNYYAEGCASYYFPAVVSRAVIYELLKRYRAKNWSATAYCPNDDEFYVMLFARARSHEEDSIRLEGVPEF